VKTLAAILVISLGAFDVSAQLTTSPLRDKVIAYADTYIGQKEATGHNDGPVVRKVLRNVGITVQAPYCAAYVSICHDEFNIPNPHSAFCPDWFRSNVVYERNKPSAVPFQAKKAMVGGLWIEAKGRVGHVFLIVDESKFSYSTDEGNIDHDLGGYEGGGFYKFIRNKRSVFIISDYCMSRDEKRKYLGRL
jgi:hypothetical protein